MKYVVTIGGEEVSLHLESQKDGRFQIDLGTRRLLVDLLPTGGTSLYSMRIGDQSYEVQVSPTEEHSRVTLRGREFLARVESEQARNARLVDSAAGPAGPVTIKSLMPGRVVRVLVAVGEEVQAGQPLLILEAMKMENEVRASRAGPVAELLASAGQTVAQGAPLVRIG